MRQYTMPKVYNLMSDPQERDNTLFPNTWVLRARASITHHTSYYGYTTV